MAGYPQTASVDQAEDAYQQAIEQHRSAVATLERLRDSVQAGLEVDPASLTEAAAKAEHAELRIEALHRKMARTRAAARTAALGQLADEVREYDLLSTYKGLLQDTYGIESAVNSLIKRTREHDAKLGAWRKRGTAFGAFGNEHGFLPPACDASLAVPQRGVGAGGIQVDNLLLRPAQMGEILARISVALQTAASQGQSVSLGDVREFISRELYRTLPATSPRQADHLTEKDFRDSGPASWELAQR